MTQETKLPPLPTTEHWLKETYTAAQMSEYARAAVALNASEWQSMESAPKDGRPMLGIHHGSSRAFEMYRGPYGWWLDTKDRKRDPSHWMPMPPPPDHFRDVTKMVSAASAEPARVPSDVWTLIEKYADAVAQYNEAIRIDVGTDKAGADCLAVEQELRAMLERYGQHQPVSTTQMRPDIADLAREGMEVHAKIPNSPEYRVCAEIVRLADAAVTQQPPGISVELLDDREALLRALADCRDLLVAPAPGSQTEELWIDAMSDPLATPAYLRAALAQKEADHG